MGTAAATSQDKDLNAVPVRLKVEKAGRVLVKAALAEGKMKNVHPEAVVMTALREKVDSDANQMTGQKEANVQNAVHLARKEKVEEKGHQAAAQDSEDRAGKATSQQDDSEAMTVLKKENDRHAQVLVRALIKKVVNADLQAFLQETTKKAENADHPAFHQEMTAKVVNADLHQDHHSENHQVKEEASEKTARKEVQDVLKAHPVLEDPTKKVLKESHAFSENPIVTTKTFLKQENARNERAMTDHYVHEEPGSARHLSALRTVMA